MPENELTEEINRGVKFSGHETDGTLAGVMAIEATQDVTLIRHAYVLTNQSAAGSVGPY